MAAQALTFRSDSRIIRKTVKLLRHPDPLVRTTAAKILGDKKAGSAVDSLMDCSEDKDWSVRTEIVRALGKIKDKRALDSLHRSLLEDRDYHVRMAAAYALYYLRDPSSIGPLDKALQDRIPEVREVAISILAYAFDKNDYYRSMMEEQKKRSNAGAAPGKQQTTDLQTLLLNGDWDQMNRLGEPAVDFLIESLEKGNPDLHIDIIIGLGYIGNEKAFDALIEQLESNNADIRFYAAEALGKFNNMDAVPALIKLLSDSHWKVKGQAADSLRRITNLFLGDDPKEWRKWWQENH
jgi:HEAT repeat protein